MKLGGNGPILANSLSNLGIKVRYVGALGYPKVHRVFRKLNLSISIKTIEPPGHTMALEFEDGKIMLGRLSMKNLNWECLEKNMDKEMFYSFFYDTNLLGMVNWTQTPYMSDIWDKLLNEYLPQLSKPKIKPFLFIDLADPQKRSKDAIHYMLKQLSSFHEFYRVILGLNEKESIEIANVQDIDIDAKKITSKSLQSLAETIREKNNLYCCVIHPVKYAVCAMSDGQTYYQKGPVAEHPLISTGAGDHFNAGFCYGQISNFSPQESLLLGVANSGYYVRTAKSAKIKELLKFFNDWQNKNI